MVLSLLAFVLGTGLTPSLASPDDGLYGNDESTGDDEMPSCPFEPRVAVVIGVLAAILCMTFFLILYGRHCKHIAQRMTRGRNTTNVEQSLTAPGSSVYRLSNLRLPYDSNGLSQWLVDALPKLQTCSVSSQLLHSQGLECPVCLSKYADADLLRLLPRCKHAFHVTCVDKWLLSRPSCPICRTYVSCQDVVDLDNYYLYKGSSELEQAEVTESVEVVVESDDGDGAEAGESARRKVNVLSFDDHMVFLSPAGGGQLRRSVSLNALGGGGGRSSSSPPSFSWAPASEGDVHSRPSL